MQDKYTLFEDIVRRTARYIARDFNGVDEDDLFQDLMMSVLNNKRLKSPDDDYVATGLYQTCIKLAWEYRKRSLAGTTQYNYLTKDVKRILPTLFTREHWDKFGDVDFEKVTLADSVVMHVDVAVAFDQLPLQMKQDLFRRFILKEEIQDSNERRRINRAVERLTDILNFYQLSAFDDTPGKTLQDGLGSRRVISNAKARYIVAEQWDD